MGSSSDPGSRLRRVAKEAPGKVGGCKNAALVNLELDSDNDSKKQQDLFHL